MFVRLLVVLISHILCCFSDLVCCRSLVQFMVQRGGIEQRWNLDPCQCDQAHLVWLSIVRSSPRGTIERMPHHLNNSYCPSLHRFIACAVGILRQLRAIDRTSRDRMYCDWMHYIQLNAHGTAIEHHAYDQAHTALCSRTHMTWQNIRIFYK